MLSEVLSGYVGVTGTPIELVLFFSVENQDNKFLVKINIFGAGRSDWYSYS